MSVRSWTPLHVALTGLAIFCLGTWIVLWLLHMIAIVYGRWRLYRTRQSANPDAEKTLPGVSVLKPLCSGEDSNLFSNLETFFTLDYPKFELLFCIQEEGDSRLRMYVESLRSKFPKVDCQIFYGGEQVGVNPKINNMSPAYDKAKYDLVLVSDSGIRMRSDTLTDMVAHMREKVGLVHQMPFVCDRPGLPSTLEQVYFGTWLARINLVSCLFGINCVTGMSCLIRRTALDDAGGLRAFGGYLAEDYFIAEQVQKKGLKLDISSQPALQNPGDNTVGVFQARIMRWRKLHVSSTPMTIVFEPISECMLLGVLAAWSTSFLFRWDPIAVFLIHVLVWFICDWVLIHIVQNGSLPFNKFEFLVTWLFREVSSPYLLLAAHFNPTIRWKTRSFRLKWGGKAEPVGEVVPVRVQDDSNCALTKLTHMTHMRSSSQEKFKL